jgi:pimeloyl-ACP methyl ester carboxylesterase/DNA-binding winged helix-turn-helix (wHTH) protein
MKYKFESFEIDASTRELFADGLAVHMEPKVFELLLHLIERCDRVVSRDELVEAIWEGRFISDSAIATAVKAARRAIGDDGSAQRYIKTIHGRGFRFVGPLETLSENGRTTRGRDTTGFDQQIRYCHSADGTRIAYSVAGAGPPLVKSANWLHHLEFDWKSPVWRHLFDELASTHTLIRYDSRGMGLSESEITDFSFERQVEDLECVINKTGFDRLALFGHSQGCAKAIAYAARHPERVTKLVLLGGYVRGWKLREDTRGQGLRQAGIDLIRAGWQSNNPAVRQLFTSLYMPHAPADCQQWFLDLQRTAASAENAAATLECQAEVNVSDLLSVVRAPTLVIHARDDGGVPLSQGQELASGIPDARLVVLDTTNHILPATDPAWPRCLRAIQEFLAE